MPDTSGCQGYHGTMFLVKEFLLARAAVFTMGSHSSLFFFPSLILLCPVFSNFFHCVALY